MDGDCGLVHKCSVALPNVPEAFDANALQQSSAPKEEESRVRLKVVQPSTESRLSVDEDRPLTRADCQPGGDHHHRPCPYVSCIHNLFLDVDDETGEIIGDPDADPWEVDPDNSCSLDVVDEFPNGIFIEEISERLQGQIDQMRDAETKVLERLQEEMSEYRDKQMEGEGGTTILGELCSQFQGGVEKGLKDHEDDRSGRVLPDRFHMYEPPPPRTGATRLFQRFGSDPTVPEAEYLRAFWKVYERSSRSRQEDIKAAADQTWAFFVDLLLGIANAQLSRPKRGKLDSRR